ncbi:hypothetical protein Q5752_003924 [Cryptotrichosporon argae]
MSDTPTPKDEEPTPVPPVTTITTSTPPATTPASTSPELRSPSPKKHGSLLGLGSVGAPGAALLAAAAAQGPGSSQAPARSVTETHPHVAHYVLSLLQTSHSSPPRHHPLSVSSSGESDDEERGEDGAGLSAAEKEVLVRQVIEMLDNEQEEEVKELLKAHMGELGSDEILMDQVCLDCMHRHRDDASGVPFATHLTPTRAPRRPFTPTRIPSFRARTTLGRPLSPAPGATTPTAPIPDPFGTGVSPSAPASAPGANSPLSSPRILNVKAATFNPVTRSAATTPLSAVPPSFQPADAWRDAPEPPRSASPFAFAAGPPGMTRTLSSNLAIAAPLISDPSSPFHSPIGTPNRGTVKMPDAVHSPATTPGLGPATVRPSSLLPDDDDDDEFSPFGTNLPRLTPQHPPVAALNTSAKAFEPFGSGMGGDYFSGFAGGGGSASSYGHSDPSSSYESRMSADSGGDEDDPSRAAAGMTPLDVLSQVFSTVPRAELEDALHRGNYDFEAAMSILVSQYTLPRSGASTPQRVGSPRPALAVPGRGGMPGHLPRDGYFQQGGRSFHGAVSPGIPGRTAGPTRMCRYYLAGECRRSDCRYSHDLERAMCRFWLRGHCAKGPNCEFLHNLPTNMDPHALNSAMTRLDVSSPAGSRPTTPGGAAYGPVDEFPDLLAARLNRAPAGRFDPSRNRFASAVKRATPGPIALPTLNVTGGGRLTPSGPLSPAPPAAAPVVPRQSNRLRLRPPTLIPTLKTGAAANEQYLAARATAIRLGHARNACLARAADAFRRGDGAAAKRFSREGKALNEKLLNEGLDAAHALVRERMADAADAVRARDAAWSDDPADRAQRGRPCAGGLGVLLGVAGRKSVSGGDALTAEERTECLVDLHTLHGNEGAEIAGQFLAELERERYRGLAYILVGEEKHVGTQDPLRGASKIRLAASVKQMLADWGYAWVEVTGALCVDPCRT